MKKYSKGTTLIEIMISLTLISVVLIFMFNILSDLKAEDRNATTGNQDALQRASYTRIIQNDMINLKLSQVNKCSVSNAYACFQFTFQNGTSKKLVIFEKYLVYNDEKWSLDSTVFDKNKIKLCHQTIGNHFLLKITAPTKANVNNNRLIDVEVTYASDYKVTIGSGISNQCD